MKATRRFLPLGLVAVLLALVVASLAGCGGAPNVQWEVKVSGAVSKPLTLSYADLAKMPQTELKDVLMQKSRGEDEVRSYSGVALAEVFKRAGVDGTPALVTATAGDGYAIEISKDELEGAIIALKDNGAWVANDKKSGPVRLVCPKTPANRWVFQLQELQVQ